MKRKVVFLLTIVIVLILSILLIFFLKTDYKLFKFGNNMNIKSIKDIDEYILNIESYQVIAEIIVESNKNESKYIVKQKYIRDEKTYLQECIEPESILGLTFTHKNGELKIENTKLKLTKIYEDYPYITENNLSLVAVFSDYLGGKESKCYEEKDSFILETKQRNGNKYTYSKKLYIDKETGKPSKLEVRDITQKTLIHILYSDVKINDLH